MGKIFQPRKQSFAIHRARNRLPRVHEAMDPSPASAFKPFTTPTSAAGQARQILTHYPVGPSDPPGRPDLADGRRGNGGKIVRPVQAVTSLRDPYPLKFMFDPKADQS